MSKSTVGIAFFFNRVEQNFKTSTCFANGFKTLQFRKHFVVEIKGSEPLTELRKQDELALTGWEMSIILY